MNVLPTTRREASQQTTTMEQHARFSIVLMHIVHCENVNKVISQKKKNELLFVKTESFENAP